MVEMENIFSAKPQSIRRFLIENGQGCYIPAYQRQYAWDENNISDLFEDVLHGIQQLVGRSNPVNFLGTIIAIHDVEYETVSPLSRSEVPARVMTIIDGQQRICTVMMSNIALHNYISYTLAELKNINQPHASWIQLECTQLLADLKNTYLIERPVVDNNNNYRFYPRIIRAYDDTWSETKGQARYLSPAAKLIWEYILFAESKKPGKFQFETKDTTGKVIDNYRMIDKAFKSIQRQIIKICDAGADENFPDLVHATQESDLAKGIWGYEFSDEVKKYVSEKMEDDSYNIFCRLLRAIIFAKYLNYHVAITIVTTKNEDDAFDMFEALNTTGEPLTAFETFKPKVIEAEFKFDQKYTLSPSYKFIKKIEEYLDQYTKADSKQKATREMLVPFALAETGKKLERKLNDQRRYLRDEFKNLPDSDDMSKKRNFVESLARIATFMRHSWNVKEGNPTFEPLTITDQEALIGFAFLRKINHSITIAPLSRFYQNASDDLDDYERHKRTEEFSKAIKATVGFSVLWRAAKGGTRNIDSHYRDIMRNGKVIMRNGKDDGFTIPPLARRPNRKYGALSLANYKQRLQLVLKEESLDTKENWVKHACKKALYNPSNKSNALARFLLFLASDDSILDKTQNGLIQRGRPECNPMIQLDLWNDHKYFTVEHIAPQSESSGWEASIYKDPATIHTLGNLILLPGDVNSVIGNKDWQSKKFIYQLLSSTDVKSVENINEELVKNDINLNQKGLEVLEKAKYLPICKSVATFDEDSWSLEIIEKRSKRFAELAWDRLHPWLFS